MIRVGFFGYGSNYQGGINYYKNLFYAVKQLKKPKIKIIVFVGRKDKYQEELYQDYVKVVKTSILDRYSFLWIVDKVFYKIFKYPILTNMLILKNKIDVISHSYLVSKYFKVKVLNWIPDFQVLHYPHLWKEKDVEKWKKFLINIVANSDKIVLSSNDALRDFRSFIPNEEYKVDVLQFVSQPPLKSKSTSIETLESKYNFKSPFFFLPNQFWKHKNHEVAFKSCLLLKKKGINITLVCSGLMQDFRNESSKHVEELLSFIGCNNLEDNIKTLGMIDYDDVLCLMEDSIAVLNPSLFEGWSSVVEESKSMGKIIVLSNIPVHIEQNPENGFYFSAYNDLELSNILEKLWNNKENIVHGDNTLGKRTLEYARKYENIICGLCENKKRF